MADSTQQETRDPQEIRQDIEHTREELGETVETLAQKADIKSQAKAKVDDVKGRIGDKRTETAERVKQASPDSAGQAASTVAGKARENRTPLIVAGVALGAFLVGRATARR
jgi:Protein of unknown function (DUF3618)